MKILVVDYGNHIKQCVHFSRLYNDSSISYFCHKDYRSTYCNELLSTDVISSVVSAKIYVIWSILRLFFISFRFDRVVFLTGPEYVHGLNRFATGIVWLCYSIFWGWKVDLYIKNTNRYRQFLYKNSLRYVARIYFESLSLRESFLSVYGGRFSNNAFVSYVYYAPEFSVHKTQNNNSKIRIGVVGSFDYSRRNYDLVDFSMYENIEFILAGKCDGLYRNHSKDIPAGLCVLKTEFSTLELDALMEQCHILLCLNRDTLHYGSLKGTGAFADAISVAKPIIAPIWIDETKEFSDFTLYYASPADLESILNNLNINQILNLARPACYDSYSIDHMRTTIPF